MLNVASGSPVLPAQFDHPDASALLRRGRPRRRPGLARRGRTTPGFSARYSRIRFTIAPAGVAEAFRGLGMGETVDEERAQRLITVLV